LALVGRQGQVGEAVAVLELAVAEQPDGPRCGRGRERQLPTLAPSKNFGGSNLMRVRCGFRAVVSAAERVLERDVGQRTRRGGTTLSS
jgi:hypothetical protein